MNRLSIILAGLVSLLFPPLASTHHGFTAHFDPDRVVRLEGVVKQFDFVNPHAFLYIEAVDNSGVPVEMVCELPGRSQLVRRGADETLFTVGESIAVDGFPARRDPLGCDVGVAYFADGSSYTVRDLNDGRTRFGENTEIPYAPGTRSIFGTWIRPTLWGESSGGGQRTGEDSITPAGIAARNAYDPVADYPGTRCEAASPAANWTPPGLVTSIRQVDDEILIHQESFDVTRTVYLNADGHPADREPSNMGHSIGRFEDETLIIESAGFSAGVVRVVGPTLHSDQMTMVERLSIEEETGRLLISWTIDEPVYYSEPLTGSQILQSTDQSIGRYNCVPGSPIE